MYLGLRGDFACRFLAVTCVLAALFLFHRRLVDDTRAFLVPRLARWNLPALDWFITLAFLPWSLFVVQKKFEKLVSSFSYSSSPMKRAVLEDFANAQILSSTNFLFRTVQFICEIIVASNEMIIHIMVCSKFCWSYLSQTCDIVFDLKRSSTCVAGFLEQV